MIGHPFKSISSDKFLFLGNENFVPVITKDLKIKIIPAFRSSRFSSCYLDWAEDFKDVPKPITDTLQEIFDIGTDTHREKEIYSKGAKGIVDQEKRITLLHDSNEFIVTGQRDVLQEDSKGRYIRDYKSTTKEYHYPEKNWSSKINWKDGFVWFLIEGINEDYKKQLSVYNYLNFIDTNGYENITKGVIEKIDKKNQRNSLSLEGDLYSVEETLLSILSHPVIHYILGKITKEDLIQRCIKQMRQYVRETKTDRICWKCTNCRGFSGCKVRLTIER